LELRGRVALVTGAGVRVGRTIALALAEQGMRVAVHYNASATEAAETVRLAQERGGDARAFPGDLMDPTTPARLADAVVSALGRLDVLINSAAVMMRTPLDSVTIEEWDAMMALNLRAPFFLARAAAARMSDGGAIVNIADLAAFESWPEYLPHGISKAGVVHMTRGLAKVLAPRVRVNAIAPGAVLLPESWSDADAERLARTTPLARIGRPDDVADAVMFLLRAGYVTGETIIVDGGRHVRH
jgi:pteridine reductase